MAEEYETYGEDATDFDYENEEEEQAPAAEEEPKAEEAPETTIKAQADVIEELKQRLAKLEQKANPYGTSDEPLDPEQELREEADSRSIYVGNVDYTCTPEDLQQHFQACGVVNRVTIITDKTGQPKGFAYIEFSDLDGVKNALELNESELLGRQIKISEKRTNVPGMNKSRARRGRGFRRPYGRSGRFRRPNRYRPY